MRFRLSTSPTQQPTQQLTEDPAEATRGLRLGLAGLAAAEHLAEDRLQQTTLTRGLRLRLRAATLGLTTRQPGHGQRRQDRHQCTYQARAADEAAELVRHLVLTLAEHVVGDLRAVLGVDVVDVDVTLDEIRAVGVQRRGQGLATGRVLGGSSPV